MMSEGGGKSAAESLEDELFDLCKSELLSEEGLRAIIDTPNHHHYNLRRRNRHVDDVDDYSFFIEACDNEKVTEGIIQCLLEYFPDAADLTIESGWSPLHFACNNKSATPNIIQLLLVAAPDSVGSADNGGWMPLHILCFNSEVDEKVALQILKLLIETYPEAARHAKNGQLPIHLAREKSLEFYQVLIESYPGSERITTTDGDLPGTLPLHSACWNGTLSTVKYLYQQYPDAINHASKQGNYPIHAAISSTKQRNDPAAAVKIVQFLLDCDPNQKLVQYRGNPLIHFALCNDLHIDAGTQMINVILSADPTSIRSEDNVGRMPLHTLCCSRKMDDAAALQILKLLLEKYQDAVRHVNNHGVLPIHLASCRRSPEFCRVLIETYPGAEQMPDARGALPLHLACAQGSLTTVEYLYRLYPESIHHATTNGSYPIFYSMCSFVRSDNPRGNPAAAVEIVHFLLDCDPRVKTQTMQGWSLLRYACGQQYNDSNIEAGIQMIKVIFDVNPEAIEDNWIASNIHRYHQQVRAFINNELVYARQAKDLRMMATPDDNGQLPLHTALQNNVTLGSIKLLVKGNPAAILSPDNSGALPLHSACQHHDSASVVNYLVELDPSTLTLWIMMGTQLFISLAAVLSMR